MSNFDADDGRDQPTMTAQGGYQQPPMYQQQPPMQGYGYYGGPPWSRMRRQYTSETKPFYLTSEFGISLIAAILIAITAASSHAFGAWRAWILISALVVAYTVSRGIAKAGTHSHASDPRDNLDLSRHSHNGPGHDGHNH